MGLCISSIYRLGWLTTRRRLNVSNIKRTCRVPLLYCTVRMFVIKPRSSRFTTLDQKSNAEMTPLFRPLHDGWHTMVSLRFVFDSKQRNAHGCTRQILLLGIISLEIEKKRQKGRICMSLTSYILNCVSQCCHPSSGFWSNHFFNVS